MKYKSSQRVGKAFLYLPYKLLVILFCLSTLACNRESGIEPIADETNSEAIQLGASVNLQTRATEAGFEQNDSIGLYLAKWQDATTPGSLVNAGNYADNALFRLNSLPDSWTTPQTLYYPADGGKLDFYAYYPYRAPAFGSGTVLNLEVAPDQSVYRNYTRSDFMLARTQGVKRSTAKVHLDFYHRLSQIVFELKPGVGFTANDLKIAKVKIVNAITDGTFNLADTMVTAGTTRQDITPCGSWEQKDSVLNGVMAILMPQDINTTTYIEVSVGNRKFSFKPSPAIHLNQTCSRVFTITVNNTGIDVETQIHPWKICPPVQGNATEEEEKEWIIKATTAKQSVGFFIFNIEDEIIVDWGDGTKETNNGIKGANRFNHTYTDKLTHEITFYGSRKAITQLGAGEQELNTLDISRNLNLELLVCSDNKLKNIDISKNVRLTGLNCSNNQLTILNVSENTALKGLVCTNNQLTNLNVSSNTVLESLDYAENRLTNLNLSQNIALKNLYCQNNLLTSLDLSNNLALKTLYCDRNKLKALNVNNNILLNYLQCERNQLIELDVSQNLKLSLLSISQNQLTSMDLKNNMELQSLFCEKNPLETLDVSQNTNLTYINCDSCRLNTLDLSSNLKLEQIIISSNQLTSLDIPQNTQLDALVCSKNPFVADTAKITSLANALPDLTGKDKGFLLIENNISKAAIQSICTAKNWKVE